MAKNTKGRHLEIYTTAVEVLEAAGGVMVMDDMTLDEKASAMLKMAREIKTVTDCHIDSAKKNLEKAMRRARYDIAEEDNWGGKGRGGGRPKGS